MSQPNYVAEFNWPVGKEIPSDLRRLTVNEFYLAIQLAARSVREMKEPQPAADYRERYEQLIDQLNNFVLKKESTIKEYIDTQIEEVTAEIAAIQGLLSEELRAAAPVAAPEPEPQPEPQPPKKKAGRPKKVTS
jgi:hypothetical protein